jgi:hypothetical protein
VAVDVTEVSVVDVAVVFVVVSVVVVTESVVTVVDVSSWVVEVAVIVLAVWISVVGVDVVHTLHAAGQTCSVTELLHISATPRDSIKNRQKIGSLTPLQSGSVVVVEDAVSVVAGVCV